MCEEDITIPEGKRKAYTHSCFATSTGNHDLFLLLYRHFSIFELMWEHSSCKYLSDWGMRVEHGWAHVDIKGGPIIASR